MNILVDIGHPAHVHLFKNFIWKMEKKGNNITVTTKDEKSITDLLKIYGIEFISLGKKGTGLKGKIIKQALFDLKVLYYLYKHNIDIAMGTSISIAHACLFHKSKSYLFNEDNVESAPFFAKTAYPFADKIITPRALNENHGKKHIQLDTLHELAYLHPNNFKPNSNILKKVGIKKGDRYFVLRFNSLKAHHDKGIRGLPTNTKSKLISLLEKYGEVLITSEDEDKQFEKYQIRISPDKIHDLMYYSSMFIRDGQTMTSEAALLGTPSIRCNDFVGRCPAIEELEHKYGLTYGFKPEAEDKMFIKIKELLQNKNLKKEWQEKKEKLFQDKIDLNEWMVGFVEENEM